MIIKKSNQNYAGHKKETVKSVFKLIGIILLVVIITGTAGFVIKSLWNWLMPEIFNLGRITYWQGIGLLILFKILFGGISQSSEKSTGYEASKRRDGIIKHTVYKEMQKNNNNNDKEDAEETVNDDNKEQTREDNLEQEKLYEEWWIQEGEARFDEYMKSINDSGSGNDSIPDELK